MLVSLYDRLGGREVIEAVVATALTRHLANPLIAHRFAAVDAHRLRRLVTQFFCGATGGPEHYEGKSVREVHRGMNLGEDEYLAFAGDFASALRAHGVRPREETEFLAILERLKGEALRG